MSISGAFQPTHSGYDNLALRQQSPPRGNGLLSYGGRRMKLRVFDVTTGFSMSGSTAQSAQTRTFFPRNFKQPSYVVSCQFHTQEAMADVVELIRKAQHARDASMHLAIVPGVTYAYSGIKGTHFPINLYGYVKSVDRAHERFVYAPELRFEFIVERSVSPHVDQVPVVNVLPSWKQVIEEKKVFVSDPDAAPGGPADSEGDDPYTITTPGPGNK